MRIAVGLSLCLCLETIGFCQSQADLSHLYQRVICVVPLTGKGTWADPKRPLLAPLASQEGRGKSGILAYYQEPTDDGTAVIAVIVAADRASLQPIFSVANASGVAVFEHGKQTDQQIQSALTAVKKNFDLKRFLVRVP
jgi:hypothetical protein